MTGFVCLAFILSYYFITATGSAIEFTSSGSITPLQTETTSVRCSINETNPPTISGALVGRKRRDVTETSDNVHPVAILITRNGQKVASIIQYSSAKAHTKDTNMHVTGVLEGSPGNSGFIEIEFMYPTKSEQGTYTCEINTLDDFGHGVIFVKNLTLEAELPTIDELVHHIHNLQIDNRQHQAEIANQSRQLDNQNLRLDSLQSENTILKNNVSQLNHVETGIIDCGDSRYTPWSDGNDHTGRSGRIRDITQTFNTAYDTKPVVFLSITDPKYLLNSASYTAVEFGVHLKSVNTDSFIATCFAYSSHGFMYNTRVSWISIYSNN